MLSIVRRRQGPVRYRFQQGVPAARSVQYVLSMKLSPYRAEDEYGAANVRIECVLPLTAEQAAQLRKELLERTEKKLTAPAVNLLRAAQLDVSALICGAAEDAIAWMKKGEA